MVYFEGITFPHLRYADLTVAYHALTVEEDKTLAFCHCFSRSWETSRARFDSDAILRAHWRVRKSAALK